MATGGNTSVANSIVVNSVSTTNSSTPSTQVYTSQANISIQQQAQQQQQQQTNATGVVGSLQQHQQQQQQSPQQYHQQTQQLQTQPQITQIQTIPAQTTNQLIQQQQQQQTPNTSNNNSSSNNSNTNTNTNTNSNNNNNNSGINSNTILSNVTNANNNNNISSGGGNNTNSAGVSAASSTGGAAVSGSTTTPQQPNTATQGNTKEKCRKFLANLIDLSTREPKSVEKNVRSLIQELVNANVEPEDFCDRLERLLNASPQPCLIGFLKKSLPLLRHALYTKELIIEGIKPPPQHAVPGLSTTIQQQFSKIQAQIRPITQNQTTTIGQTQVRMISPAAVARPIGHTTITKQPIGGIRIQGHSNGPPRLLNTQIRGPIQQSTNLPQIHPNIVHIRAPTQGSNGARPATVHVRAPKNKTTAAAAAATSITTGNSTLLPNVKLTHTQIKPIAPGMIATTTQPPSLVAISNSMPITSNISSSASILSTINSVATNSIGSVINNIPIPSLPIVNLTPTLPPNQQQQTNVSSVNSATIATMETPKLQEAKVIDGKAAPSSSLSSSPSLSSSSSSSSSSAVPIGSLATNKIPSKIAGGTASKSSAKKKKEHVEKDRDETKLNNSSTASNAAAISSFFQQPSISMSSYGDDDINDVAAMGGVNLAEETQRILGCTENIGTQIRSCKDELFLHLPVLQARIRTAALKKGMEEPSADVAAIISHACQERIRSIIEKLSLITEHRCEVLKIDPRYEPAQDVRSQIKFLEELDKAEQKRHEEMERELLLRAAKSRTKIEDPEQAKMKARAKEMQRAEMEELRQRDANMTALQAIGPRKKIRLLDGEVGSPMAGNMFSSLGSSSSASTTLRPRIKRVNLRDMQFYMEQDPKLRRSLLMYKSYLK